MAGTIGRMADHRDPVTVFGELARLLGERRWDDAARLYADDVRITHRFTPGATTTSVGRDAVRAFFGGLGDRLDDLTVDDAVLTPARDPEVLTAEFAFAATADGDRFRLPAVFVLRVRDGLIVSSHDYVGPRQD